MVKARSLLVFSTVSFGLVTLQGGSGGCGGGASVGSCTKEGVTVNLLPGDCAPIPACGSSGYFAGLDWILDASTLPAYLTVEFRPLAGASVANICATTAAPIGGDFRGAINGDLSGAKAETKIHVHIRGESSMHVELAVDGAPIVNGWTLISASKTATVNAAALVGSFTDRTGNWSLLSSSATFKEMSATSGKGALMTPAAPQLTDLVLQLNKPGSTTEPSDDVFSLPVRIMEDGGAAVTVRQLESSYRGIPCPGMTESPTCQAEILCFSAAGSILNWPPGSSTEGRQLDVSALPDHPANVVRSGGAASELFAACAGAVTSVTYSIRHGAERLDSVELQVR